MSRQGAATAGGTANGRGEERLGIEQLPKDGWEIVGYTGTFDNRSSLLLLLLKHKERGHLVQCSIQRDMTRGPRRTVTNRHEVR